MNATQPVLVVIVNNQADWQRVVDQRWYRIPVKHAPTPLAADGLAFYFTKEFGDHAWQVRFYAPVLRYRIAKRAELLPDQPAHRRAHERYYCVDLGGVTELPRPVPSRSLRRVTFIPTTWEQLCTAADVAELWQPDDASSMLWNDFPDAIRKATARLIVEERST